MSVDIYMLKWTLPSAGRLLKQYWKQPKLGFWTCRVSPRHDVIKQCLYPPSKEGKKYVFFPAFPAQQDCALLNATDLCLWETKKIIILASDTVRLGNTATVEKVVQSQGWLLKLLCKAIKLKVCSTSKAGLIFNCSSCLMHLQSIKNVKLVFLLSSESINKLLLGKHLDECVNIMKNTKRWGHY